jgi:hypothetical protein
LSQGPRARITQHYTVLIPRTRDPAYSRTHPAFARLYERLLGFLPSLTHATKILAINVAVDPTDCLLLPSYGVLTVTNPSARDGVAVKFGRDLFPENQLRHAQD